MQACDIKKFISQNRQMMFDMLKELCLIPAPSHFEHSRAEYCKQALLRMGAKGVYVDSALNVVFPINCENSDEITVLSAHTDTVFADTTPMPYHDDGERIHCPGVSDDTSSVAVLLMTAKYFIDNGILPEKGLMIVLNSCEEGLGNLKGTRRLFEDYEGRIARFVSFDSSLNVLNDRCVGSHRYEVEVLTEGGHSFADFGKENAITRLAEIVSDIYKIKVPAKSNTHTTYNVGSIVGGTSVNTIAQNASMLCEYRSDDYECLEMMQKQFECIFEKARADGVAVNVRRIGDRPCGSVHEQKIDELKTVAVPIIESVIGEKVTFKSSSTDCNIPLSLGIPAVCVGTDIHSGTHTREEWMDKKSLLSGLEIAIRLGIALSE